MSEEKAVEATPVIAPEAKPAVVEAEPSEKIENFDDYLPDYDTAMSERKEEPKTDPDPKDAPADADAPAEEPSENTDAATVPRSDYEALLARLEALEGGTRQESTPAVAPEKKEQVSEEPATKPVSIPKFEISPELADQIGIIDPGPLNKAISAYVEQAINAVPLRVNEAIEKNAPLHYMAQKFFDENPGFDAYPNLVNKEVAAIMADNPALRPREVLAKAKDRMTALIGKATKIAKSEKVDIGKPGKPETAPGASARKDGGLSKPKFDPTTRSLLNIGADEPVDFFND